MKSNQFYTITFFISVILATTIKFVRGELFGINIGLDIFLGSSPSFFYVFGLIAILPVIHKSLDLETFKKYALALTAGAFVYEVGQSWSDGVFDVIDLSAIILAAVVMLVLHKKETSPDANSDSDMQKQKE